MNEYKSKTLPNLQVRNGTMSEPIKLEIVWRNVSLLVLYHLFALHGVYFLVTKQAFLTTFIWMFVVGYTGNFGVISGTHRLWSHRTYKAKKPLRILLMLFQSIANQNSIFTWARDHRVHHKFADTDADPHNINRGFFFAHMGWLLCRKHPDVVSKGSTVDISDLLEDEVVAFQHKYFHIAAPILSFIIPASIPWYFWNEHWYVSFAVATMLRYILSLHVTWLVNSAAHCWGTKPYDGKIKSAENLIVSYLTWGEGFHNYHHVFPFDYKAAELDTYNGNLNTAFIDVMAKIGWAYDRKTATSNMVKNRKLRNQQEMSQAKNSEEENEDLVFVQEYVR